MAPAVELPEVVWPTATNVPLAVAIPYSAPASIARLVQVAPLSVDVQTPPAVSVPAVVLPQATHWPPECTIECSTPPVKDFAVQVRPSLLVQTAPAVCVPAEVWPTATSNDPFVLILITVPMDAGTVAAVQVTPSGDVAMPQLVPKSRLDPMPPATNRPRPACHSTPNSPPTTDDGIAERVHVVPPFDDTQAYGMYDWS